MEIQIGVVLPPRRKRSQPKYGPLITALRAACGNWISVAENQITGETLKNKESGVNQAAKRGGIKIQTRNGAGDGKLYLRMLGPINLNHREPSL
jgi:hypothetical protein